MKSFITYQLIIFSIICVKLNSQNLAVLDIAPINYEHDYSLKISKHIRNIIKNNINIKIMDIDEISNILDKEDALFEAKSFNDFYYLKQLNEDQNFFNINSNSLKKSSN